MATRIQLEIEDAILKEVDEAAAEVGMSREAYITTAIKHALGHHRRKALWEQEAAGYRLIPPDDDEVDEWSDVQDWGDPWAGPDGSSDIPV